MAQQESGDKYRAESMGGPTIPPARQTMSSRWPRVPRGIRPWSRLPIIGRIMIPRRRPNGGQFSRWQFKEQCLFPTSPAVGPMPMSPRLPQAAASYRRAAPRLGHRLLQQPGFRGRSPGGLSVGRVDWGCQSTPNRPFTPCWIDGSEAIPPRPPRWCSSPRFPTTKKSSCCNGARAIRAFLEIL